MEKPPLRVYWAGDRGFYGTSRWYDGRVRDAMAAATGWTLLNPFDAVASAAAAEPGRPLAGPDGLVRQACLGLIRQCDVVVAYVGGYDTGTAQEMEFARALGKPIVAWSDAALVKGEVSGGGREVHVGGGEPGRLPVPVLPMNAMTTVHSHYYEDSRMAGPGIAPETLARRLAELVRRAGAGA